MQKKVQAESKLSCKSYLGKNGRDYGGHSERRYACHWWDPCAPLPPETPSWATLLTRIPDPLLGSFWGNREFPSWGHSGWMYISQKPPPVWSRNPWPLGGQYCQTSQAAPTASPVWFSGPKREKLWFLETFLRDQEIKETGLLCFREGILPHWEIPSIISAQWRYKIYSLNKCYVSSNYNARHPNRHGPHSHGAYTPVNIILVLPWSPHPPKESRRWWYDCSLFLEDITLQMTAQTPSPHHQKKKGGGYDPPGDQQVTSSDERSGEGNPGRWR